MIIYHHMLLIFCLSINDFDSLLTIVTATIQKQSGEEYIIIDVATEINSNKQVISWKLHSIVVNVAANVQPSGQVHQIFSLVQSATVFGKT